MSQRPNPTPEFSRPRRLAQLQRAQVHDIDERATETEQAGVAALLDLLFLAKLRLHGRLEPVDDAGWRFEGVLGATATQACVVSLQPVKTRLDVTVQRTWLPPAADIGAIAEIELDAEALDDVEPLSDPLDLGLLAIEELALALPSYPRAEGVETGPVAATPPGAEPITGPEKPFAVLAGLRDKLQRDGE